MFFILFLILAWGQENPNPLRFMQKPLIGDQVSIDLFITKEDTGSFYFFKQLALPADSSFVYDISYNAK